MPPVRRKSPLSGASEFANEWFRWGESEHHDHRYSIVVAVARIAWLEFYDPKNIFCPRGIVSAGMNPFHCLGKILAALSNLLDS